MLAPHRYKTIATTYSIWRIRIDPTPTLPAPAVDRVVAFRNIPQRLPAIYAPRSSLERTTYDLTSEPTLTSDLSSAQSAAKLSQDNTIGNDTRGCIQARKNLSAKANSAPNQVSTGAAADGSRVPMPLEGTSEARQAASA